MMPRQIVGPDKLAEAQAAADAALDGTGVASRCARVPCTHEGYFAACGPHLASDAHS